MDPIKFGYKGVVFEDLYNVDGLNKVDALFVEHLQNNYPDLVDLYRDRSKLDRDQESEYILQLAPSLEEFLCKLFKLDASDQNQEIAAKYREMNEFRRNFIQRKASKISPTLDIKTLEKKLGIKEELDDIELYDVLKTKMADMESYVLEYSAHRLNLSNKKFSYLFFIPKKLDFTSLIDVANMNSFRKTADNMLSTRDGFDLTDEGGNLAELMSHSNYCLYCHDRDKDSCSKGFYDIDKYKKNPLDVELKGCPLEEKISEMNLLSTKGLLLGALATAIIDNPMLAATGHRICNDCMKACIYQKQQPVDIPKVESTILNQTLELDYGFEIYSLLTRWNPLNHKSPIALKHNKKKTVMVAGLGPAGFTLSHYLLNQGYGVIAVDGLKIEPLEPILTGIDQLGKHHKFQPIKRVEEVYEALSERIPQGFGGVAEYGITVRWNKNYLKVIRLLLERRAHFRMYGSTRIGSDLKLNQIKDLGVSHLALCFGAGSPKLLQIPNIMAKGVRFASDFLMALQLSGAHREDSNTNLEIRMPIAVIGGGLTAIDTATESLEYYAKQVVKVYQRYQILGEKIFEDMSIDQQEVCREFIDHGKRITENPDEKLQILKALGGATICYRKSLEESTAYKLNHEEVDHAFREGIEMRENIVPLAIELDATAHISGIRHKNGVIPAKSIFIATGTKPNTVLAREVAGVEMDGIYFKKDMDYSFTNSKRQKTSVVMKSDLGLDLSFFGDLHPEYAGNVVKAMASAKDGYPSLSNLLESQKDSNHNFDKICDTLNHDLDAEVIKINHLAPKIVEIVVRAPNRAINFRPGQFYRIQNFESNSKAPQMEPLALTGAWSCSKTGKLSLIILEMGGSSDFCKDLQIGEKISLMGPTGAPTFIPKDKKVMLVGGGLGNAVLFSIGKACEDNGCEVLYFAGYKQLQNIFKRDAITESANQVVWCCDEEKPTPTRQQDLAFHGNIVEAIKWYDKTEKAMISCKDITNMIVIGSDQMMAAVSYQIHNDMKSTFPKLESAIASINSPMQCMMKEICGQCIQRHIDPKTEEPYYIYSCFNQDQPMERVDFAHLNRRLQQNEVLEKVCKNWLEKASN